MPGTGYENHDVCTAADTARKQAVHAIVAAPEPPHIVPVVTIPLRPTPLRETAYLIGPGGVPNLGDNFHFSQDRDFGDALY